VPSNRGQGKERRMRSDTKGTETRGTWVLALTMLLGSLGTSIANIALPTLARSFATPFAQVQAVIVAYLAALTLGSLVAGRLGDRFGLRAVLLAGLWLFLSGSLFCAVAPGLPTLVAARAVQGAGAAGLITMSMAMIRQTAAPSALGRAMGLLGTSSALGTALGAPLGGLILPVMGWRGIFWLQLPLAALALALTLTALPRDLQSTRPKAPGLLSVLDRMILPGLALNLLVAAVMMTTLVTGPFYLGTTLGLSETVTGLVMAVGPVLSILTGLPSGRLVDAKGAGQVLLLGLALMTAGAAGLTLLPGTFGLLGYIAGIALLTPGYQLFQAANNTSALSGLPPDRRGTVAGLLALSRNLGLITGASVMGAVFAWGTGSAELAGASAEAIAAGLQLTFAIAASGLALALVLWVRR
jgi:predicted MFS family arabinose efflux permease